MNIKCRSHETKCKTVEAGSVDSMTPEDSTQTGDAPSSVNPKKVDQWNQAVTLHQITVLP